MQPTWYCWHDKQIDPCLPGKGIIKLTIEFVSRYQLGCLAGGQSNQVTASYLTKLALQVRKIVAMSHIALIGSCLSCKCNSK